MQMKKVIAAVCSVIGITVPATSQAHFIDSVDENTPVILRHASELQNNNIVIDSGFDEPESGFLYHTSHYSHYSHTSHRSHYSHYSSSYY